MSEDRRILIEALEIAVAAYRRTGEGHTILTQPAPDESILGAISAAFEKCDAFKAVSGRVLFSANSGMVIHSSTLAAPLLYRAERDIPGAADWVIRILSTRQAVGLFRAAIWGLSVDQEVSLGGSTKLLPFASLPSSRIRDSIQNRGKPMWDGSAWLSQMFFDLPRAAFIREVPDFPYIRTDRASFDMIERLERESRELWTLLEVSIGHPLAFGYWFEYADHDLDISSWENAISWSLPEVIPYIARITPIDVAATRDHVSRYVALPNDLRERLLRSMNRFTLSQCRRVVIDRVLDLSLAFETAVSGDRSSAPLSWKVSHRSAQFIGGDLPARRETRDKVAKLYTLRNQAAHGSRLKDVDQPQTTLQDAAATYRRLLDSFLRLGKEPDWQSIELEPTPSP